MGLRIEKIDGPRHDVRMQNSTPAKALILSCKSFHSMGGICTILWQDVLTRENHSEPILLIPPSLVETKPLLASPPFGTVHPVGTVNSPTIYCYSEYNQCHEQE